MEKSIRQYLRQWCRSEGLVFLERGECGICRTCVGVLDPISEAYPDYGDYQYSGDELYPDGNIPYVPNMAHKYPCVAVVYYQRRMICEDFKNRKGMKEKGHWAAMKQLYKWIKWFDKNGYHYQLNGRQGAMVKECV